MPKRPSFSPFLRSRAASGQAKPKEEFVFGLGNSSLGHVLLATSATGVVSISIDDDPDLLVERLETRFPQARLVHEDRDCQALIERVVRAIEKPGSPLTFRLDLRGTAFQIDVWNAVRQVPVGQTSTYSEIASIIGKPKAIRAVGTACANCHMSIVVPCHRILHKDGSLSPGCFWGPNGQRTLLDREAAAVAKNRKRKKSS